MATQDYLNFELNIEALSGDQLRITVSESPAGSVSLQVPNPITADDIAQNIGIMEGTSRATRATRTQQARAFGEKLFSAIFTDDVYTAYMTSLERAGERGLRIKLGLDAAGSLQDVPWELLRDPRTDYLGLSRLTPVTRYPKLFTARPLPEITLPLRVLVMIASPIDQHPLEVEAEWATLQAATEDLRNRGLLELERIEDAQLVSLQKTLRDSAQFHIFHFIGHSAYDEASQTGLVAFEDPRTQKSLPVSGEMLARELADDNNIRLVVFNACQSARQNMKDPFGSIASSLVARGIPAVVAMQFSISDEASRIFSQEFYEALSEGYPIEAALTEARRTISGTNNSLEWATPVLYLRAPNGILFARARAVDTAVPTGGVRERLRSPGCIAGIIAALVVLIAAGFLLRSLIGPRPPTLTATPTTGPTPVEPRDVDLTITSLRFLPPNPAPGQRVAVSMVFKNNGSTDSGPFKWAWFIEAPQSSAKPTLSGEVDNIGPGLAHIVAQDFYFPRWGTFTTTAWVNFDSSAPETNFFNNLRVSPPVNVTAPLSVDFTRLPDGSPLLETRDLKGDEFSPWGFKLSASAGNNNACNGAVVRLDVSGDANRIEPGLPGSADKCFDMPVIFDFDSAIGSASVEFLANTAGVYTLDVLDGSGKKLSTNTVTANVADVPALAVPASGGSLSGARRVVFTGPSGARIAIQRATFSPPPTTTPTPAGP